MRGCSWHHPHIRHSGPGTKSAAPGTIPYMNNMSKTPKATHPTAPYNTPDSAESPARPA